MVEVEPYPTVVRTEDDVPPYIDCIDRIVAGLVFRYRPPIVVLVRIRKWFDHRWLRFSGKGRVFFDTPFIKEPCVSLDPFHQDQLTFPPFAPTRVASEHHWARNEFGNYARTRGTFRIHSSARKHSATNLQRRVANVADAALFVWFSSATREHDRGSALVYIVSDNTTIPWFASIRSDGTLGEVEGLGRVEVAELLEHPPIAR